MAKDTFAAAVDDSHLLMAFLSRRSLTMDTQGREQYGRHASTVARVQTQVGSGQTVSEVDLASFWDSFNSLLHLASPVTIESIRSHLNAHFRSARRPAGNQAIRPTHPSDTALSKTARSAPFLRLAGVRPH